MQPHLLRHPAVPDSLALAVISSSEAPLLLLDGDLAVVAASASFCRAFSLDHPDVVGRSVLTLGSGEWNLPQLRTLLKMTATGHADIKAYEIDLVRADYDDRRLVLSVQKLNYADETNIRLMLAATDVTEARINEELKDQIIREKETLLRELNHRVANSLQIICSVLLQTARKVQSPETRIHLNDAHNRVMSIAAVQRHLSVEGIDQVDLRRYLTQLCESLAASMIRNHNHLRLEVDVDDSMVGSDDSMSLGLIVTELVINAIKHAFLKGRKGKINVSYKSQGEDWILTVTDNGIGMPAHPNSAKAGLGTSIIEALARQLRARVSVGNGNPGTSITVVHSKIAAYADGGNNLPSVRPI